MRLLIVSSEFPPEPGGIGTQAYHLAQGFTKLGWDVAVMASQDVATREEWTAFNPAQPFEVVHLRRVPTLPLKGLYRLWTGSHTVRRFKPDLLLATGQPAVWITAWLALLHGIRHWIAVGHGTEFEIGPRWRHWLNRLTFPAASAVICVSNYTWQLMVNSGIRPLQGSVIPNGADLERFGIMPDDQLRDVRRKWSLNGSRMLLTVGKVTRRKGQDTVIQALPAILEKAPHTIYIAAGMPTQEKEFTALAQQLNVQEHVRFAGLVSSDTLVELMNLCDVFVLNSRHIPEGDLEGYGIAVLEAALCGKPAIVSTGTGLPETIIDGVTGIAVPQDDPHATADAVLSLLMDDQRRQSMGMAARDRSVALRGWEATVREYHRVMCRLIKTDRITNADVLHLLKFGEHSKSLEYSPTTRKLNEQSIYCEGISPDGFYTRVGSNIIGVYSTREGAIFFNDDESYALWDEHIHTQLTVGERENIFELHKANEVVISLVYERVPETSYGFDNWTSTEEDADFFMWLHNGIVKYGRTFLQRETEFTNG
jgi:phosphatidyl-myo-inositol dimannoside synthase